MQSTTVQGYRLSPQQRHLWSQGVDRAQCAFQLTGELDSGALKAAVGKVLDRHEILRTRLEGRPGIKVPIQVVTDTADLVWSELDLQGYDSRSQRSRIDELLEEQGKARGGFGGPSCRFLLVRQAADRHVLLVTLSSLFADPWTIRNLLREVGEAYARPDAYDHASEDVVQYVQFSEWRNEILEDEDAAEGREFWRGCERATQPLRFPYSIRVEERSVAPPARHILTLVPEAARAIGDAARRHGVSLPLFLLAGWQTLLFRITLESDVVVLHTLDGRKFDELHGALGLFASAVPVQARIEETFRFEEVLRRASTAVSEAQHWQEYFLPEESSWLSGDWAGWAIGFEFEEWPAEVQAGRVALSLLNREISAERFQLQLACSRRGETIVLEVRFDPQLFRSEDVRCLAAQLATLLDSASRDALAQVRDLEIRGEAERRWLAELNDTGAEPLPYRSIHEIFEEQAERNPGLPALVFEERELTYHELNVRANRLAHRLRRLGVGPDARVALLLDRSEEVVVAMLAVLKAGGAYVPLDPGLPAERLAFMIDETAAAALVTNRSEAVASARLVHIVHLEQDREALEQEPEANPGPAVVGENLAYVLFTSGSTGRPKGVAVEHRQLLSYLLGILHRLRLPGGASYALVSSFAADLGNTVIFPALCTGGCLHVIAQERTADPDLLAGYFASRPIDCLKIVPSHLSALLGAADPKSVLPRQLLVVGGEATSLELAARIEQLAPGCRILNHYGPTETTVGVVTWPLHRGWSDPRLSALPLGRPLANSQVYVLDPRLEPVPAGLAGELYIGGLGVSRGYLGRPDLTAERFVPAPSGSAPGARLYRTGDVVRLLPEGVLRFEGRLDHQVKIRGFRVELGEIDAVLRSHPEVREAVSLLREDEPGQQRLASYAVPRRQSPVTAGELRAFLRERLPEHMVPVSVVLLERLPLNANGKIDRRVLPIPEQVSSARDSRFVAPRTLGEEMLAGLWADVLGTTSTGVHDSFFELGGHSLLATQLISRVRKTFQVELTLLEFFENPTVAGLACCIERARRDGATAEAPPIESVGRDRDLPLSFAQERLWFLAQIDPASSAYNVPKAVRLAGTLDVTALERALTEIVKRHEILRTTFSGGEGSAVQVVHPASAVALAMLDLSALPEPLREPEARRLTALEAGRTFDLARGPLLRAAQVRVDTDDHLALLTLHHIVSDGWSMGILISEMAELYDAFRSGRSPRLPELPVQYADFAVWQRGWFAGEVLAAQLAWWRGRLAGAPAALELPTDRPRPAVLSPRGGTVPVRLPAGLGQALMALSRREGTTLFMTLLGLFQAFLARHAGTEDLVVGSPIAGRTRSEVEPLIGFFVNTLVLRGDISGNPGARELLIRARETALGAYAHQDLPFERLVEELSPERDMARTPLFQVVFALQNVPAAGVELELTGLELSSLPLQSRTAKFDLNLALSKTGDELTGDIEYSADLFDVSTVVRLGERLRTFLEGAAADPDRPVWDLPLLPAPELQQVLVEWSDTSNPCPQAPMVHELFSWHARRQPQATAMADASGRRISYGELESRSNRLAHYLCSLGVRPEVRVAVCMERNLERAVAILGTVKAGGAYVTLDPTYPAERLAFLLEDAGAEVLLTQESFAPQLPRTRARMLRLDTDWEEVQGDDSAAPESGLSPENLAYVVYTSGSTGRSKGVEIPHTGLMNLVRWHQDLYDVKPGDRGTQIASPAFDASIWELWPYLSGGASLFIPDEETRLSSPGMIRWWAEQGITLAYLMTPLAEGVLEEEIPEDLELKVRALIIGGDRLHRGPDPEVDFRLMNHYGPAEYSVTCTVVEVPPRGQESGIPTIGRAIANTSIYILDRQGQPVPVGVPGELYVAGVGLARGYHNRPDLTAEKFVPDPFASQPGARMYRTADLVRWLPDGDIDFLGRLDHQVKIRGFRIELGEIESVLGQHLGIREVAVLVREDRPGAKRLIAYAVPAWEPAPSADELQRFLRERLPEYMVPAVFVSLESLPLTPNGKVDRQALEQIEPAAEIQGEVSGPRTPAEELVTGIWCEVLKLDRVGAEESFFELGGHSLLATQVMSRVRRVFGVEVPLRALFESPTVAGLADRIERALRDESGLQVPVLKRLPREGGTLPLSFAQQRLWFLDQWEAGGTAYNIPTALRLVGCLRPAVLEAVLGEIVRRHESLRTTFESVEDEPVQRIHEPGPWRLPVIDLGVLGEAEGERLVRRLAEQEARRPFDLERGPLLRSMLLRLDAQEHVLLATLHHIVSDGWSTGVLIREMSTLYQAFAAGGRSPLPELAIQYADYAVWQRRWLTGEVLEEKLSYWRNRLNGAPALLELPLDRPRPAVRSYQGASLSFSLTPELSKGLSSLGRRHGATAFMTLLAGFQALLSRYTGQDDVVVGTPIAGRTREEMEDLIGFFVNTLALRTDLSDDPGFLELVGRVRNLSLEAHVHQEVPFEKLVEELSPERNLSHSPLFQVLFQLQNVSQGRLELPGLEVRQLSAESRTSKFDLSLGLVETGEGLRGGLEYHTDLFDRSTMRRLVGHLEALLSGTVAEPERRISELPLLSEGERRQLLGEWSDGGAATTAERCLHTWFERQAERSPEAVALVSGEQRLSYGELGARADRLARRLLRLGVGPEVAVGVLLERTPEMMVSLLAVLKAGGAYVPLPPSYPAERLVMILEDSRAAVVLTQTSLCSRLSGTGVAQVCLDVEPTETGIGVASPVKPDNLAYVIFTSGSTGRPKGVAITHRNASALLGWALQAFSAEELAGVFASTSIGFDLSVFELFVPLACGGTVVLGEDALALAEAPGAWEVTLLNTVPSAMAELLSVGSVPPSVRTVNLAGEPLRRTLSERLHALETVERVWNLYGPTEDTTYSTFAQAERGASREPVIGRPLPGSRAFVVDAHFGLVPAGVPGELLLGGAGLVRGYLHRADLTAERFIPDPFSAEPGARLYRTGDMARWLVDGRLDYLGRLDHQVKIRGFRIELGEVEVALRKEPWVRDAVVLALGGAGDLRLVAYVAAEPEQGIGPSELRSVLASRLPAYMVPSAFVVLPELPLTPNGKVDRRALARIEPERSEAGGEGPDLRTLSEELLAGIWCEVLRLERVGVAESFFELGGHSLLATQVVSRVRRVFGVELPLRALFEAPTVQELAARIEVGREGSDDVPPLVPVRRDSRLPLSFAQQRLWFLDQWEAGGTMYNMPTALRLTGRLQPTVLEAVLGEVVRRHESLRTTFESVEGEPAQCIHAPGPWRLGVVDLSGLEEQREDLVRHLAREEARQPFDLAQGPVLRTTLLRLDSEEHVLLATQHHIVSDGWSTGVLIREMSALYRAFAAGEASPLTELTIQYGDYAVWQRRWLSGEVLERKLSYWRDRLAGAPALLELPLDRPRPAVQGSRGDTLSFGLSSELSGELLRLGRREGATAFMMLLAGFQVLLSRYTGRDDVVVGTPIAGRVREETEDLIGFFVNTLVLRTDLSGVPAFGELLARVRERSLEAHAHQEVPFEKLVEELAPERSLSHSPLFQILFQLQNVPAGRLELPGLEVQSLDSEGRESKFDLSLGLTETGEDGLRGWLVYSTDLFDRSTVRRLAGHFETLLAGIAEEPERRVSELPLLSPAERHQAVAEWNDTAVQPASEVLLLDLLAEQAPELPAVTCGQEQLTHGELAARSDRLAAHLRALGAGPDVLVALFLERSVDLVVALLAVLKAGGAYLPLDTSLPRPRLSFLLDDARPPLVLTRTGLLLDLPEPSSGIVCLDDLPEIAGGGSPTVRPAADNLAYVLYTSGSTGTPKGVAVTHRGLANYLLWAADAYPAGEGRGAPVHSPVSFDLTVTSLFLPLLAGRCVDLVPEEEGVEGLAAALAEGGFGLVKLTPAHLEVLQRLLPPARVAGCADAFVLGGEPLFGEQLAFWRDYAPGLRLINEYGPTETVVGCCTYEVPASMPPAGPVSIGRPIANTRILILDPRLSPVPIGVSGELYLGGAGVCRGYLHRPGLTAEKLIPDPFGKWGERLYRTGDLARRLPDGRIEILGRLDHQVKVRGFRIELGEIEAALVSLPGVREAVVLAQEDRLVAYVAGEPGEGLRPALSARLPAYMVPSVFVVLGSLPLTPNGKVDRRALARIEPERSEAETGSLTAPRDRIELELVRIWEELLGVAPIGVRDDFFALGGHSLLAVRLRTRIKRLLGHTFSLADLFRFPTIELLARALRRQAESQPAGALVALRSSGSRPPVFCVHAAGGNVVCYQPLARHLGADQPFYGLQSPGLDGDGVGPGDIESMADRYASEVEAVQPGGPLYLAGWSMGGVVAFEMARRLRQKGREVALLALLDSQVPNPRAVSLMDDEPALLASFALDLGLQPADFDGAVDPLADGNLVRLLTLAQSRSLLPPDLEPADVEHLFAVFRRNVSAMLRYRPGRYPGHVLLLAARDGLSGDPTRGWEDLAADLEVREVPGTHFTLIREPHAEALAGVLRDALSNGLKDRPV